MTVLSDLSGCVYCHLFKFVMGTSWYARHHSDPTVTQSPQKEPCQHRLGSTLSGRETSQLQLSCF